MIVDFFGGIVYNKDNKSVETQDGRRTDLFANFFVVYLFE